MAQFPEQETAENRKPPTEIEAFTLLSGAELPLSPLSLRLIDEQHSLFDVGRRHYDGIIEVRWGKYTDRFAFEYKTLSTPRTVTSAADQIARAAKARGVKPMVVVPYLSKRSLVFLEQEGVSGIDLCGNALVLGKAFRFFQTGYNNLYKTSAPIKNIYRGTSSLLARCFLLKGKFESQNELRDFAVERFDGIGDDQGQPTSVLSKSTISKVVKALEEDMIVMKDGDTVCLINANRLLSALRENYEENISARVDAKTSISHKECWQRLRSARNSGQFRSVTTGLSSASYYGVLSVDQRLTIYVDDMDSAMDILEAKSTTVFPNLRLIETKSDLPYFDARDDKQRQWASPIQTWIELAVGGPRERDASQELQRDLLEEVPAR